MPIPLDKINDAWGFFGTLRGGPYGLSTEAAHALFNFAADQLGGPPDAARQYLNSQAGRHFADSLTFLLPEKKTPKAIKDAILRSKQHREGEWFWKKFAKFRPYEDAEEVVESLLAEDGRPEAIRFAKRAYDKLIASGVKPGEAKTKAIERAFRETEVQLDVDDI